ncbi:MAG: ornithine cyclodeaminase family protein [Deltaproteobacteria bacterium]|nr:ornithine cyclodeaminase family protein [Deltaproteobacteria bacterium]
MTERSDGQVLLLNNADVESVLTIREVIRALDEAYLELDKGQTANRPRTFTFSPTDHGRFVANTHEGLIRSKAVYDIRVVTHSRPDPSVDTTRVNYFHGARNCSLDMLYDINTGDLLAIIHDGYLQKMRVQATNAIAARTMGKKNANSMALIGTGWQASAAIEAMRFVRPIEKLNVFSRSAENRRTFVQRMRAMYKDIEIQDFDTAERCVRGTDMVVAATNSKVPVCKGEWIEKGMHLTGVLPYEFDLECYKRADHIVIFNRLHGRDYTLRRGPEEEPLDVPPHAVLLKGTPEIADLVSGKVPGRLNDDQITIFANGGHGWGHDGGPGYGIQFTAMAKLIYDLAKERGLGRKLPLEWFQQNVNS